MTSKFKYRERSAETVAARAKQSGGGFDSYLDSKVNFVKVKEGENVFRILPPTWDMKQWGDNWGIEIWIHRDIGPDNNQYLCLEKMGQGDCPLCQARSDSDLSEEDAKSLKPSKQILAWVINRDDEKAGPQVWRLGWQLEKEIQLKSQNKKTGEVIPIDHPDYGFDISFVREGQGLRTKYLGVDVSREETPIHDKQAKQDAWLEFITENPLPDALHFYDAEYLENVYMGKAAKEDDRPTRSRRPSRDAEDAEDERPSRSRSREPEADEETDTRATRRRPAEAEAEEERPRRRPREPEPEAEEERPKRRRADPDEEAEETDRKPRKRPAKDDHTEEEEAVSTTTSRAKASLERLKPKDKDEKKPARRRPADEDEDEIPF